MQGKFSMSFFEIFQTQEPQQVKTLLSCPRNPKVNRKEEYLAITQELPP